MKSSLNNLKRSIKTELIKKKYSGIFNLSIIFGAIIPLLGFIIEVVKHIKGDEAVSGIPVNHYMLYLENSLVPFAYFFFPLLIIYSASKITQIDHKNKGWHLMETLPATKFSVYFSKFIILLISNSIAIISLLIASFLFVFIESSLFDGSASKIVSFPLLDFLEIGFRLFVISLCISSLQYVLSVLIASFVWPLIIGFIMVILPAILSDYNIVLNWYPYQLFHQIADYPKGSELGYFFTYSEILALLYTVIALYIGFNWYRFKSFFRAFTLQKKRLFKFTSLLVISMFLIYMTLKPKQQEIHHKTILTGKIESDKELKTILVFDVNVGDTIAKIPVVDNSFKQVVTYNIPSDLYIVQFDNYSRKLVYFGNKDSLYLSYKFFGTTEKLEIKGTRAAENIQKNNFSSYTSYSFYLDNNLRIDDESFYMDGIYEDWQKSVNKINAIRTVDNIIPREDYIDRQTKLVSLEFLNYWNDFKKKRAALYPDKPFIANSKIKQLENSISLTETQLLSNSQYQNYILEDLIKEDNREIPEEQKYFTALEKLERGSFRDKLLYGQLNRSLNNTDKVSVRDSLLDNYLNKIDKESYRKLILKQYRKYNRLSKGATAPNFMAYNTKGEEYNLNSFKGNLVLIDFWASWCGPCKQEDPFFERKALIYKNKPIKFISMNIDKRKEDWFVDLKNKGKSILQLRPNDINKTSELYSVNSIPRFILIDKEGKFINSYFVRPSSKVFDELIKSYL